MLLSSRVRLGLGSARPAASSRTCSVVCQAAAVEAKPSKVHPSPLTQAAPSNYAVIEVGGSQLFVEPGKWYTVNRLKADVGSKIKFGRVLLHKNQDKVAVGQPYLEQVNVRSPSLRATSARSINCSRKIQYYRTSPCCVEMHGCGSLILVSLAFMFALLH